jgi:hypothetical protein
MVVAQGGLLTEETQETFLMDRSVLATAAMDLQRRMARTQEEREAEDILCKLEPEQLVLTAQTGVGSVQAVKQSMVPVWLV